MSLLSLSRAFLFQMVLGVSILLTACQTSNPVSSVGGRDVSREAAIARDALLEQITAFTFEGGLGVWTDDEALSARLRWQQTGEELNLELNGPLGIGDMRLHQTPKRVTLHRGDAMLSAGDSVDSVVQQGLGLSAPIPFEELGQWVKGLPGNATHVTRGSLGQLVSLDYKDKVGTRWQARFKRFQQVDNQQLPALITASGGQYSVRLRLKNWQLSAKNEPVEQKQVQTRLPIPGR